MRHCRVRAAYAKGFPLEPSVSSGKLFDFEKLI